MLLAGSDVFLIDRDKWAQGQYLRFGLGEMLGQRKPAALRAAAGLLHREVLLPEGGRSLLDQIDEKSHKHAFAVSTDLKFGVQQAIELIGNEVVYYKREVAKEKLFDRPELAAGQPNTRFASQSGPSRAMNQRRAYDRGKGRAMPPGQRASR